MTKQEKTALDHIRRHGHDKNLQMKMWTPIKIALARKGLIRRRVGDWAWVPNDAPKP